MISHLGAISVWVFIPYVWAFTIRRRAIFNLRASEWEHAFCMLYVPGDMLRQRIVVRTTQKPIVFRSVCKIIRQPHVSA